MILFFQKYNRIWPFSILNFFDCPYINVFTEKVNNKVEILKISAHGSRKFQGFHNRILHAKMKKGAA